MNEQLEQRVRGLFDTLMGNCIAGDCFNTDTKGYEREIIVNGLLKVVFPPAFRFGTGEIIDDQGEKSGQLDVVVEIPTFYSLTISDGAPRLYLADGVAAVIEIKTNLTSGEQARIAAHKGKLDELHRNQSFFLQVATTHYGKKIPYFVIAFRSDLSKKALEAFAKAHNIDGIFIIEKQWLISGSMGIGDDEATRIYSWEGSISMMYFLEFLRTAISLQHGSTKSFFPYFWNDNRASTADDELQN